jgi:hypothetical protein
MLFSVPFLDKKISCPQRQPHKIFHGKQKTEKYQKEYFLLCPLA